MCLSFFIVHNFTTWRHRNSKLENVLKKPMKKVYEMKGEEAVN